MVFVGCNWRLPAIVIVIAIAVIAAFHDCLAFQREVICTKSKRVQRQIHRTVPARFNAVVVRGRREERHSIDGSSSFVHSQEWGEDYCNDARIAARLVSDAVMLCEEYQSQMQPPLFEPTTTTTTTTEQKSNKSNAIEKTDGTPVTALDFAIQGYIVSALKQYEQEKNGWTANHRVSFLGEESAEDLRDERHGGLASMALDLAHSLDPTLEMEDFLDALDGSEKLQKPQSGHRSWILDPIDGTKGLLQRKQYCIGLALCTEGRPVVGILGSPSANSTTAKVMVAVQHHGLRYYNREADEFWDLPRKIPSSWHTKDYDFNSLVQSSSTIKTSQSSIPTKLRQAGIDYPPYLLSMGPRTNATTTGSASEPKPPLPFGPFCRPSDLCCGSLVKYFAIASGQASGFVQLSPSGWVNSWDHAPGILCVQESGGSVFLVESKATTEVYNDSMHDFPKSNTLALPAFDRPQIFIHRGIVAFAKESGAAIQEQMIDSVRRES